MRLASVHCTEYCPKSDTVLNIARRSRNPISIDRNHYPVGREFLNCARTEPTRTFRHPMCAIGAHAFAPRLGTQSLLLFLNRRPARPIRSSPSAPLRYEPIASLLGRAIERAHDPLAILVLIVSICVCVSPRARAVWQPEALVIGCCLMSAEYE